MIIIKLVNKVQFYQNIINALGFDKFNFKAIKLL